MRPVTGLACDVSDIRGDRTPLLPFASMSSWGLYFVFLIPPLIIGFVVQHWLKKTVAANMQVEITNGLTGAEVARQILDRNGLQNVPVERSPGGPLSDHYDPRKKSVHLSEPVYGGHAVASTAIAAHEVGHAIQHAKAYAPFKVRSALWPAVAFASNAWIFLLLIGAFAQLFGLVAFAILLYAVVVLFQLVTLPVEFDASRRAMSQLNDLGLVTTGESQGARKVLTAAAMTYVAAALAALSQLAYYALVFLGNRN
jgi:Predicted Zn-dependent protease